MNRQEFIGLLTILLCIMLVTTTNSAETHDDKRGTISVTGSASENYPPDTSEIILAIENTAVTVSQATQKNNTISEKVIGRLKKILKPEEGDTIKTSSYSLQPAYEYDQNLRKNKFIGYKVTNQLTVKTKQLMNAGKLIDSATEEGVNRVDNISFTISDNRDICKHLLRQAAERAKSEAEVVAQALGTKIVGIKDVSSSCGSEMHRPVYQLGMAQEDAMMAKSVVPVEAGTINLQSTVRAVFYIDSQ